jgi:hypothetical protein
MSKFSKLFLIVSLSTVLLSAAAQARGVGTHANDAKYYGPVYGWRYFPPPAAAATEPACGWTSVRVVRNGHSTTRRVRRC